MSTIAYAAVNVSERQADLAAKVKKLQRRKKRDKESSDAFTTSTRDDNDDDDDSLDEEEQEMKNKGLLRKAGAVTAAIATAGMNIFSIFSFGGSLIYAAGGVATVVSTTVATREVSLENVETFVDVQNALRTMINEMALENTRLTALVEELSVRVFCLKEAEQRLKDITKDQNLNVKNIVNLIHEHDRIQKEKRRMIREDIVASVMREVLRADADESGAFDDKEIKRLLRYVKGLPNITVNERRLARAVRQDRALHSVLELVHDIGRSDLPAKKRIFLINDPAFADEREEKGAIESSKPKILKGPQVKEKFDQSDSPTDKKKRPGRVKKERSKGERTTVPKKNKEKSETERSKSSSLKKASKDGSEGERERSPTRKKEGKQRERSKSPTRRKKKSDVEEAERSISPTRRKKKSEGGEAGGERSISPARRKEMVEDERATSPTKKRGLLGRPLSPLRRQATGGDKGQEGITKKGSSDSRDNSPTRAGALIKKIKKKINS